MTDTYSRTTQIERGEGGAVGHLAGLLVTDGEASDGHIIDIKGLELPERAPLLFGHDDYSGTGNLGSWTSFRKVTLAEGGTLGARGVRGQAAIELDGAGAQQAFRADVAHMIDQGHIGAFSVRWDATDEPVRRVNLPSDHPAYVDPKKAKGRQQWGMWFPKSKLLEGSVVTLGADPAALIGRMHDAPSELRGYWRSAVNRWMTETHEASDLVGVQLGNGEVSYVERAVYEAMLEAANERLQAALDAHESALAMAQLNSDTMQRIQEFCARERVTRDDRAQAVELSTPTATLPVVTRDGLASMLREVAQQTEAVITERIAHSVRRAKGKIS